MFSEMILRDDIRDRLWSDYRVSGATVKGQAISWLLESLRERGHQRLLSCERLRGICEDMGFKVAAGTTMHGQRATVVFLGGENDA